MFREQTPFNYLMGLSGRVIGYEDNPSYEKGMVMVSR